MKAHLLSVVLLESLPYPLFSIFNFLQMANITVTYRDGRVSQLEQVYIRGSKIRFLILPDMLKNAPMLKSMKNKNQAAGAGRGKAAILKAQGIYSLLNPVHISYRNMFFVCVVFIELMRHYLYFLL